MCSGRLLARRSIYAFVAILLARYDIEVEPGSVFPQADGARPSPGVILVGKGEDVKLRCTPRRA